jgi:hypothetical protein
MVVFDPAGGVAARFLAVLVRLLLAADGTRLDAQVSGGIIASPNDPNRSTQIVSSGSGP